MTYEYDVVPFLGRLEAKETVNAVSAQLEALLNRGSANGWEFHSLVNVNIEVRPGCVASFLGKGSSYMRFDQVVFLRLKPTAPEQPQEIRWTNPTAS